MIALPSISLRTWGYIGTAAIIAGLVIALLLTRETLDDCKRERTDIAGKLSVSNSSIDTLTREIDRMNKEAIALANDDANRIAASRQALEMVRAAEAWRAAAIDRLNASAIAVEAEGHVEACEASAAVAAVWN